MDGRVGRSWFGLVLGCFCSQGVQGLVSQRNGVMDCCGKQGDKEIDFVVLLQFGVGF